MVQLTHADNGDWFQLLIQRLLRIVGEVNSWVVAGNITVNAGADTGARRLAFGGGRRRASCPQDARHGE